MRVLFSLYAALLFCSPAHAGPTALEETLRTIHEARTTEFGFSPDQSPVQGYYPTDLNAIIPVDVDDSPSTRDRLDSLKSGLEAAIKSALTWHQFLGELSYQSISYQHLVAEFYIASINNNLQLIEKYLQAIRELSEKTEPHRARWNELNTRVNDDISKVKKQLEKLHQRFDLIANRTQSCSTQANQATESIQQLFKYTDPQYTLTPVLSVPLQGLVSEKKVLVSSSEKSLKQLTLADHEFSDNSKSASEVQKQVQQVVERENLQLQKLNDELNQIISNLENLTKKANLLKQDLAENKRQSDQTKQELMQTKDPAEAGRLRFRLDQLNHEAFRISAQLNSVDSEVSRHEQRVSQIRGAFEMSHSSLQTAFIRGLDSHRTLRPQIGRNNETVSNLNTLVNQVTEHQQNFCRYSNELYEKTHKDDVQGLIKYHELINNETAAAPKDSRGIIVSSHGFELLSQPGQLGADTVFDLANRQIILESHQDRSPEQFQKDVLELSRDLITAFDHSVSTNQVAADEISETQSLIKTVQDYGSQALSLTLGFVPYIGKAKDLIDLMRGKDSITGLEFTEGERVFLAMAIVVPISAKPMLGVFKSLKQVVSRPWMSFFTRGAAVIENTLADSPRGADVAKAFLKRHVPKSYHSDVLESAKLETAKIIETNKLNEKIYTRYWGGESKEFGFYLTEQSFSNLDEARRLLALEAGNTMEQVTRFRLKPGYEVMEATVAKISNMLPGGAKQIYVPFPDQILEKIP